MIGYPITYGDILEEGNGFTSETVITEISEYWSNEENQINVIAHYPFTYGDKNVDEVMLSDYVVELMKTKRFQSHVTTMFFALLVLGSYAQPSLAIPPEYGEAAANVAQGIDQTVPPLGEIAGTQQMVGNNAAQARQALQGGVNPNPVGNGANINQFGQNGVPGQPQLGPGQPGQVIKPPAWRLPGPPQSPGGQYFNTVMIIGSISWICLNASWGNPVLAYGCVGVLGGILNELRKKCL